MALLIMASPYTNEQTRMAINEMSRNRGCYKAPKKVERPTDDEQVKSGVCRTLPVLLSQHDLTRDQKATAMDIAIANGCIR